VKQAGFQIELVPTKGNRLRDAQAVPVHQCQQSSIAVLVPSCGPCGRNQLLDLCRGQVLAGPQEFAMSTANGSGGGSTGRPSQCAAEG